MSVSSMRSSLRQFLFPDPPVPTTVHVTHAKAASTWIDSAFRDLFPSRVAPRGRLVARSSGGDLSRHVFAPGFIYPAMFWTREEFLAHEELREANRFVVIRDLRDTLVSLYFSLKYSHSQDSPGKREERAQLESLGFEDGLLSLLPQLERVAAIQSSWLGHSEIVLRYEDMLHDAPAILSDVLLSRFGLPATSRQLSRALRRTGFEKVFGRKFGDADPLSHGRQGLPGDWRKHFTPALCGAFEERFGAVLRATGYAQDRQWPQDLDRTTRKPAR
jgi:hypothetical protein